MTMMSKTGAGLAALLIALGAAAGASAQQSRMPTGQGQMPHIAGIAVVGWGV